MHSNSDISLDIGWSQPFSGSDGDGWRFPGKMLHLSLSVPYEPETSTMSEGRNSYLVSAMLSRQHISDRNVSCLITGY